MKTAVLETESVSVVDSTNIRGSTRVAVTDGVSAPNSTRALAKEPTRAAVSVFVTVSVKLMVESGASISTEMSDQLFPDVIP